MKKIALMLLVLTLTLFAQTKPQEVKVGVYVSKIFDINFAKNEFSTQFWLWFHHADSTYKPNKITEVVNAKEYKQLANYEKVVKGVHWDLTEIRAKINQQWQVEHFPFDVQKFTITLEDIEANADSLAFIADKQESKLDPKAIPNGWSLQKFEVSTHTNTYNSAFGSLSADSKATQDFSRVSVDIYLKRDGWRLFATSFIGFFVATALLFIAFMVISNPRALSVVQQQPRITLIIGALFSAIGSIYGLSAKLPYTTEFTLADSLEITTFIGVAFAAIGSVSADVFIKQNKLALSIFLNRILFALFLLFSFGLNGLMLLRAIG